jgi:hypothetical protein
MARLIIQIGTEDNESTEEDMIARFNVDSLIDDPGLMALRIIETIKKKHHVTDMEKWPVAWK